MKSRTRRLLSVFPSNSVKVKIKAKNLHALSHEQKFLQQRFLDICHCAFNVELKSVILLH